VPVFQQTSLFDRPEAVTLMVVSTTLMVVGLAWIHHITGFDDVAGGARWRARDGGRAAAIKRELRSLIELPFSQTAGWWVTRIEFALATGALVFATIAVSRLPAYLGPDWTAAWPAAVLTLAAYAGIVFGIRWMRRIYLSPRELDPDIVFRYRG
jgi:hypothetical protein